MTPKAARSIQSVQWLPAERLGQMNVEPTLRAWLIAKGMLSARVKAACGEHFIVGVRRHDHERALHRRPLGAIGQ